MKGPWVIEVRHDGAEVFAQLVLDDGEGPSARHGGAEIAISLVKDAWSRELQEPLVDQDFVVRWVPAVAS